jgi:hypothetical protein
MTLTKSKSSKVPDKSNYSKILNEYSNFEKIEHRYKTRKNRKVGNFIGEKVVEIEIKNLLKTRPEFRERISKTLRSRPRGMDKAIYTSIKKELEMKGGSRKTRKLRK